MDMLWVMCSWHQEIHGLWVSCLKKLWVWRGQYPCWDFSLERKQQFLGIRGLSLWEDQCPDNLDGWELGESVCLILMEPCPSAKNLRQVLV